MNIANFNDSVYNSIKLLFYFVGSFFILYFLFFVLSMHFFSLAEFTDELITIFMLAAVIFKALNCNETASFLKLYFLATVFFVVISWDAISKRGAVLVLSQVFIHLKVFVYIIFLNAFFRHKLLHVCVMVYLLITVFLFSYELIFPGLFHDFFDAKVLTRQGIIRPIGIQGHTALLGSALAFLSCYLLSRVEKNNIGLKVLILCLIVVLIYLSSIRTALIILPIFLAWWMKKSIKGFALVFIFVIVFGFTFKGSDVINNMAEMTSQNIENTVENPVESGYIRGMMIYFSFVLANENFPLGTGASTFGTSSSDNSHVYVELGVENSSFFIEKEGIYDSNFASVLGEFGYAGCLFYYFLLFIFFSRTVKGNIEFKYCFYGLIFAYSISNPVFMNSPTAFLIALLCVAISKDSHSVKGDSAKVLI